jgi:phosphomannomutase/phosphoglucomutase
MSETSSRRISAARLRPLLPVLALLCGLLALWLGYSGWRQWQGDTGRRGVETARDAAVEGTARALAQASAELARRLAAPAVQAALASGDTAAAAAAVRTGWAGAEQVEVLPAALDSAYAGLASGGFGRLAVAEAALAVGKPVARVGKDGGQSRLLVAAPAPAGAAPSYVAVARLPLSRLTAAFDSAPLDTDSYLALRQGEVSVAERGNAALAVRAEVLSKPVGDTGLRIAGAADAPEAGPALLGLGAIPALGAAALLALLALACLLAMRRGFGLGDAGQADAAPTLAQALEQETGGARADPDASAALATTDRAPEPKAAGVAVDAGIFRAYDIRGVVGDTLDAGVAELIGQAIGTVMHEKELQDIVVGRDGRLSGPDMVAGLIAGLRKAGRNVIDIGLAPTPLVYFGSYHLRTGCCVAVTGSHNPPDYNGFKIVLGGETLSGATITDLYDRIATGRLHAAAQPGSASQRQIDDDYVQRIANDVQLQRPLKIVVDAGNGVAGQLGPRVLEEIGAQVVPLYCEIDGTFPNHHPDPSEPHNLVDLIATVQREGADLGLAFDGDGDRLGVVTPAGDNIFPDRLLMLFAADVLERNPGAVILYDVKCTGHLSSHILRNGGSPLMWKTGHSLIKAKMRETGAELAGEMSGHFFFAERWFGFDDGIYAAARLLEILAARDDAPADVLRALPGGVSTPEIKVPAPGNDPHGFVERFRETARFEEGRISTIDGVRVDWPDGWGLIRASNTTPVLVLRFDADSEAALQRVQAAFREQLQQFAPELVLPF